MSNEERDIIFERKVEEANKILEERYMICFLKNEEKHKLKIKIIKDIIMRL
jgi:sRNA-binding protein